MKIFASGALAIALLAMPAGPLVAEQAVDVERVKPGYSLAMEGMT